MYGYMASDIGEESLLEPVLRFEPSCPLADDLANAQFVRILTFIAICESLKYRSKM